MNSNLPDIRNLILGCIVAGALFLPRAATDSDGQLPQAKKPVKEIDLARVVITPEAEARLSIRTEPIKRSRVTRRRPYGAEIMLPFGQDEIGGGGQHLGTAPLSELSSFQELDPPTDLEAVADLIDRQMKADERVDLARVELAAAEITLARAERLLSGQAGSVRDVDDARARGELARAKLANAERQRAFWGPSFPRTLSLRMLWVRVPVYAGDYSRLDTAAPAALNELARMPGLEPITVVPVTAPPSADPETVTVDLYYRLEPNNRGFRPGQRVLVDIPFKEEEEGLVIPWSALLRDIHGGTWVYENTEPQTYTRRGVVVRRVVDGMAVLKSGPAPGAKIVTEGAAELFSTEFGFGK